MKKFTLLMVAMLIAAMSFAQGQRNLFSTSQDRQITKMPNKNYITGNKAQTRATRALECADNALFSTVDLSACTSAGTSNSDAGYYTAVRIDGFTLPLASIRFFGAQMFYNSSWTEVANVETLTFDIKIFADNSNEPGAQIASVENVALQHTEMTDLLWDAYSIFQFDYTFETPIDVPATFWIEVSNSDDNVWFMWLNNESGNFVSAQYDEEEDSWTVDNTCSYQICLIPQAPQEATVVAMPLSLSFNGIIGSEIAAQTVSVSTFNLTSEITATTAAPFSVSIDGTTFATTATIPTTGGTLYVKYTPTEAGTQNGTIVLTTTGVEDVTIHATGTAIDCGNAITALPYTENFSNLSECWTMISNNTANETGTYGYGPYSYQGEMVFRFSSYSRAEDYNQYLITPELGYTEDVVLRFDYATYYGSESFRVMVSSTNNDIASFTALGEDMTVDSDDFLTYMTVIPAGTKYIAINYFSNYSYYLYIDNFSITEMPNIPEIALTSVSPVNNTTVHANEPFSISGVVTNNGPALTSYTVSYTVDGGAAVEYTVNEINVAMGSTHNFTHATPITLTTEGNHTIVVTVSNPNGTADNAEDNSMTINVNAISCNAITEFPYTEGFENGIPECWTLIDADGDGLNWEPFSDLAGENAGQFTHSGNDAALSLSYDEYTEESIDADNWMFTQAITLPAEGAYMAEWYAANVLANYADTYEVYVATAIDVNALANATPAITHMPGDEFELRTIDLTNYANQTIYIAFHHADYDNYGIIVDDFAVKTIPTTADVILTSVAPASGNAIAGTSINVSGVVTNNGAALTSYTVSYSVDGGEAVSHNVTNINVAYGSTHNFTHPTAITLEAGIHTIVVTVSNPNGTDDADDSNNSKTITMNVADCSPITEFPYTEDFENGIPACWTLIDADGDGLNWEPLSTLMGTSAGEYSNSGDDAVMSASYNNNTGVIDADNWMFTQAIAVPAEGQYVAEWYASSLDEDYLDTYYVYVATSIDVNALANATPVLTHTAPGTYERKSINLTNYAGQTIYIAFNHYDSDNYVLMFDDFSVKAGTVAVEENIAEAIAVYPNPANSVITIANAEGQDITIVNTLGQVVSEINNAAANQTIDISNLANGTYFVKVNAEVVKINVVK